MVLRKTKKTRKSKKMQGRKMGTHGSGARKNKRKSGNRGGCGMAGSGKRADHRKTLITKLYGNTYFGKKGVTSRGTKRDKRKRINLTNIKEKYFKKSGEKIELKTYKILSNGNGFKATIIAESASKEAIEKMKSAGGEIQVKEFKEKIKVKNNKNKSDEVKKESK